MLPKKELISSNDNFIHYTIKLHLAKHSKTSQFNYTNFKSMIKIKTAGINLIALPRLMKNRTRNMKMSVLRVYGHISKGNIFGTKLQFLFSLILFFFNLN